MGSRAQHVCPICAREVTPRDGTPKNPSFPFCAPACKLVDLGRWLDGAYRIPEGDDGSASDEGNEPAPREEDA